MFELELWLSCSSACGLTCVVTEGPFLACSVEIWGIPLRSIPGVDRGLPRRRGAAGNWLCHPGRIYPRGVGAAFFSNREGSALLHAIFSLVLKHPCFGSDKSTIGSPRESQGSVPPRWADAWSGAFHRWSVGGWSVGTAKTSTRSMKAVWPHRQENQC